MLHAQCSLREDQQGAQKGDVIVLALPDHPWGTLDRKRLFIVEWEDPVMEQRLLSMQGRENPHPVIVHPYAIRTDTRITQRATLKVDMDSLTDKQTYLDRTVTKPILRVIDYQKIDTTVKETGIVGTILNAIASPFVAAWEWLVA